MFVNGKEIFNLKADNKNVDFSTKFCLEIITNGFGSTEFGRVSLKGNVHGFSVDYNAIDRFGISKICKYLMVKNYIK